MSVLYLSIMLILFPTCSPGLLGQVDPCCCDPMTKPLCPATPSEWPPQTQSCQTLQARTYSLNKTSYDYHSAKSNVSYASRIKLDFVFLLNKGHVKGHAKGHTGYC